MNATLEHNGPGGRLNSGRSREGQTGPEGQRDQAACKKPCLPRKTFRERLRHRLRNWERKLGLTPRAKSLLVQAAVMFMVAGAGVLLAIPWVRHDQMAEVAGRAVRADRDFTVVDEAATAARREAAYREAAPIFLLDDLSVVDARERVSKVFSAGRRGLSDLAPADEPPGTPAPWEALNDGPSALSGDDPFWGPLRAEFQRTFPTPLHEDEDLFQTFLQAGFDPRAEKTIYQLALDILAHGVVADRGPLEAYRDTGLIIRRAYLQDEDTVSSASDILSVAGARRLIEERSILYRDDFPPQLLTAIVTAAQSLMAPNLLYEPVPTQMRREAAAQAVPEVIIQVKAGEIIVREGERIDEITRRKLAEMSARSGYRLWRPRAAGLFLLIFTFLVVVLAAARSGWWRYQLGNRDLVFIGFTLIMIMWLAHLATRLGAGASGVFQSLDEYAFYFLTPLALPAMLAAVFIGPRNALFAALLSSALAALVFKELGLIMFFYSFLGSVTALARLRYIRERGRLVQASLWVVPANLTVLAAVVLFMGWQWERVTAYYFVSAVISGFLSGVIALGLIPLMETLFGYSSNLKLMELGNLDRPLLRELMMAAPGTYHHSVIVGAMAEAAAEAIGANPLLAKVAAYYHDLGKLKKPLYFVENQSGENRHETLAPSLSALILASHVKDGVELARKNRLPGRIIDIIQQHHGTGLMAYFYHKAREIRLEHQPRVEESDYRYPGPKPQTKEAALVMLADITEAATRSLDDPSPGKIQNLTQKLVANVFSDGQLDECELTFKDVFNIKQSFDKILIGIYHRRLAYPHQKQGRLASPPREPGGRAVPEGLESHVGLSDQPTKPIVA